MRKTTFVVVAILASSCAPVEKAAEGTHTTSVYRSRSTHDVSTDTLYSILEQNGLMKGHPRHIQISVITESLTDVNRPDVKTNYVAALYQAEEKDSAISHTSVLAVFDASQKMKLVTSTVPDFSDGVFFYDGHGVERASGQGPRLSIGAVKLSDGGEVIAITAKISKQYIKGVDDDDDVWMYALYKDEILMIHQYSARFNHRLIGDNNYTRDTSSDTELIIGQTKTKGMYDITQRTIVDVSGTDGGTSSETIQRYSFNGKEYIEN